ncbi:tRNA uridine-5-carboxymethylaminomethyl(34) synthesis GTPase MnmE [Stappia sp.]|uniref:tRNA uridine-5-carboxymethylaminomethyl(34) synthesis GTPase MnmE n=1 Tax=Stappia sp. TaxID=1870903 RepID=UPI003A9A2E5D
MDTIFALASAPGKAGVSVVRISGPRAWPAAEALCGTLPPLRQAGVRRLRTDDGEVLDEALVLRFARDGSFTGEDVVELHLHGSVAIIGAVLGWLDRQDDLRQAEAGEFTRRALENGRLDLAQVEGLADLIDAETEMQRRQAMRVLSGELGRRAEAWRRDLIRAAALIEASIDFADEEVPQDVTPEVADLISRTKDALEREMRGVGAAERVRSGFEVAIVGAPNVGKSTLLNAIAGREAAITSEYAGTTRDVIEVRLEISGLAVTLLDTAGLRNSSDHVEAIGIERARQRANEADLRVFLLGPDDQPQMVPQPGDIVIGAKSDVTGDADGISGKTGAGLERLIDRIGNILTERTAGSGIATRARHRDAMERGAAALAHALSLVEGPEDLREFAAEDLRSAVRALDSLVGKVDVENLLDEIFTSFCIGK